MDNKTDKVSGLERGKMATAKQVVRKIQNKKAVKRKTGPKSIKGKAPYMRAYTGTFKKKDGSSRTMRFAKLGDLPPGFLTSKLLNRQTHNLAAGSELVWDLDNNDFRVFNYLTLIGTLAEFEYTLR